jgi:hypothetical protein
LLTATGSSETIGLVGLGVTCADNEVFAGTVHAYGGNDRVLTASFYTKIEKSWGDLGVWGLNGGIDIRKSGDGSITTHALAANSYIDHWGNSGDITFWGGHSAARFIEMARQEMSIFTGLQLQVI